jgi:exonuclease III
MSQLKIVHWNCFKMTNTRQMELINFINIFKPDIVSLQEIKLSFEMSNLLLNLKDFTTHVKARSLSLIAVSKLLV